MSPYRATDRRRTLGAVCLVTAPLVVLASSLLRAAGLEFAWALVGTLWVPLAFGSILAIVGLLRERADRFGLTGGAFAFVGLTAAAGMMAVYRLGAMLDPYPEAVAGIQAAYDASPLLFVTTFPVGLFYPLGLIVLAVGLWRARVLPPALAASLVVGALLFPAGRIPGIPALLVASDLLVGAAKLSLARRLLRGEVSEVTVAEVVTA